MNDSANERLARLERENRRMRIAGALILIAFVGIFLLGQATEPKVPGRVSTRQLDIVDKDGNVRISIGSDDAGYAAINLVDKQGKDRGSFGMDPDGTPAVVIGDAVGKLRADFGTDRDGAPMMRLFDSSGKIRVTIELDSGGQPALSLNDGDEKSIWRAP